MGGVSSMVDCVSWDLRNRRYDVFAANLGPGESPDEPCKEPMKRRGDFRRSFCQRCQVHIWQKHDELLDMNRLRLDLQNLWWFELFGMYFSDQARLSARHMQGVAFAKGVDECNRTARCVEHSTVGTWKSRWGSGILDRLFDSDACAKLKWRVAIAVIVAQSRISCDVLCPVWRCTQGSQGEGVVTVTRWFVQALCWSKAWILFLDWPVGLEYWFQMSGK